jgi:hypothetical protein
MPREPLEIAVIDFYSGHRAIGAPQCQHNILWLLWKSAFIGATLPLLWSCRGKQIGQPELVVRAS